MTRLKLFIFIGLFYLFPFVAFADLPVTISPTITHDPHQQFLITVNPECDQSAGDCSHNTTWLPFDSDGQPQYGWYTQTGTLNPFDMTKGFGTYYIYVFSGSSQCDSQTNHPFVDCLSDPNYLGQISITYSQLLLGSTDVEELPTPSGLISYPPVVHIIFPTAGSMFSSQGIIKYQVTDQNDLIPEMRDELGMSPTPVSIYYSSTISQWDHTFVKSEDKTLIATGLPSISSYLWHITGLIEGKLYRIIVDAVDNAGIMGEDVSDFFGVDLTPPTFVISADPPVVRNENVTIKITSSENLAGLPDVFVSQYGATPVRVKVSGSGRNYIGVYLAVPGFDGTAQISVSGSDLAGNIGTNIVGGGTFSVGVNPPGEPSIVSPVDNARVSSESIDITGNAREDTQIIATVNGTDVYNTATDSNGAFLIKNVTLKKDIANGLNTINIVAKDPAGLLSQSLVTHVSFNIAPNIVFLKPLDNTVLTATTTIAVQASDENFDPLRFLYEVASVGVDLPIESDWQVISDTPNDQISFDTTQFSDGSYLLRTIADDGATTTISNILNVRIHNELPTIHFDDGRQTTISGTSVSVRGTVTSSTDASPQPNITALDYSITGGKKWIAVTALDGTFNSPTERFAVSFQNLKDGVNNVTWRATDSRGFVEITQHPIVVDTTPPAPPVVIFPASGGIISNTDNDGIVKSKFSFTLYGNSEPGSTVHANIGGLDFTGQAIFDGTFRITGITLPTTGNYTIKLYATDEASNKSLPVTRPFLYDNIPDIILTSPRDGRALEQDGVISWLVSDSDNDNISNNILSYRQIGEPYVVLGRNFKENKFDWDTTKLPEGNDYELKIDVSDGLATSTLLSSFGIDHTPPTLLGFNFSQSVYGKNGIFKATGSASDVGSGIEFVEYNFHSTDAIDSNNSSTTPWYKADIDSGFLAGQASFSINSPLSLDDGGYLVSLRAVDGAGNVSPEKSGNITVDGTAPRVGSFDIESGGTKLLPQDSIFSVPVGTKLSMTLSMEDDTKNASILLNKNQSVLVKDLATGLWKTDISPDEVGTSTILISAEDLLGNQLTDKPLTTFEVSQKGKITYVDENNTEQPLKDATVRATLVSPDSSLFSMFGITSTQEVKSDDAGEYVLLLGSGEYKISVLKDGFVTSKEQTITLNSPTFVTTSAILKPSSKPQSLWEIILNMLQFK